MRRAIRFLRGGSVVELADFAPDATLLDHLRHVDRQTGSKDGCGRGECGSCTVALGAFEDGAMAYHPVNACMTLLGCLDGKELVTIEDVSARATRPHPVQAALVGHHASQCGFCTPGMVMALFTLFHSDLTVDRRRAAAWLTGNLCRCTGYRPIIDAAVAACAAPPPRRDAFANAARRAVRQLAAIAADDDIFIGDERRFFAAPASLDSLAALAGRHHDAILLAGGSDLLAKAARDQVTLAKIIHLGRVRELGRVAETAEAMTFGAAATLESMEPAMIAIDPDLGELWRRFGAPQVRAVATLGGNIAGGDPAADLPPVLMALGATIELRQDGRLRRLPIEDFYLGSGRQDRSRGEFITEVTVPKLAGDQLFRCYKVAKRYDNDRAILVGAFRFTLERGLIAASRIAYSGLAGVPKRALVTERSLRGLSLAERGPWGPAIDMLAEDFAPLGDERASAAYRLDTAKALLLKALTEIRGAASTSTRIAQSREIVLEHLA
jgi:xanthine dehydrogenase small subunit